MRVRLMAIVGVLVLVVAACSSGDDGSAESSVQTTQAPSGTAASGDASGGDVAGDTSQDTTQDTQGSQAGGKGTATLTLDNGESFTFGILCALEPQEAAGQEILFNVVSYDKPVNLDVTQFGEQSFNGAASISLNDAESYDTLWNTDSMLGNDVELELQGDTVTGRGVFYEGEDHAGPGVEGVLVANCS